MAENRFRHPKFFVAFRGGEEEHFRKPAFEHGANKDKICLVKAASDDTCPGFMEIVDKVSYGNLFSNEHDVFADGVVLTEPGSAAIIRTADCPVLVIYDYSSGRLVAVHCGRFAMTPQMGDGEFYNIVTKAYATLIDGVTQPKVTAFVTAAICGNCFIHDTEEAKEMIKPFEVFGPNIAFNDRKKGSLNLHKIITSQLYKLGLNYTEVHYDCTCTFEDTRFLSYRRNQTKQRNTVAVILR